MALIKCPLCGESVSENATKCPHCGEPLTNEVATQETNQQQIQQTTQQANGGYQQPNMLPKPDNHMVTAILITLCCCIVPGIVSIVYAVNSNSAYSSGDYAGAVRAANSAKTWINWGLILGGIYYILVALYFIFIIGLGAASSY